MTIRVNCVVAMFVVIASLNSQQALAAEKAPAVELPLKKVVMFNTGVAYYEHQGTVEDNAEIDMRFDVEDINDLLKSMVLEDAGGGKISTVSCDALEPITETLRTFTIDLTEEPTIGDLLRQIRGERVTVDAQAPVEGVIIGIELRQENVNGQVARRELLNLLTDKGLRSLDLAQVLGIRLSNKELDDELRRALTILATGGQSDKRTVRLRFEGKGRRAVRVGYIRQSPVWKTSYRLVLRDEKAPLLQGWAIVENTSEIDWNDIELTLVSGQPISFVMNLYEPLFVQRPEVRQELFGSLLPPVHRLDLAQRDKDFRRKRRQAGLAGGGGFAGGGGAGMFGGGGFGGGLGGGFGGGDLLGGDGFPDEPAQQPFASSTTPTAGIESQAAAKDVGDSYEYRIKGAVSIARRRSAMLPIVNDEIKAEKVSVFNPNTHAQHPFGGLRLENVTKVHLTQGPITVFDLGAYAGESQIEAVKPKSKRLVSYALDLETEVVQDERTESKLVKVSLGKKKASLALDHQESHFLDYSVKNSGERPKKVMLEYYKLDENFKIVNKVEPAETTDQILRFAVEADPGREEKLAIIWRKTTSTSHALRGLTDSQIHSHLDNEVIGDEVKVVLRQIQQLRALTAALRKQRSELEARMNEIVAEQRRIRDNMRALVNTTELHRRFVAKLVQSEDQLEELRTQRAKVMQREGELLTSLNAIYGDTPAVAQANDDPFGGADAGDAVPVDDDPFD
jgi:hypothetical protein